MRQFILIDHSLKDLGGHHFPYAHSVLQAAARAGFQPALATHHGFSDRSAFDPQWRIQPVFRHESYSRHTLDTQSPQRSLQLAAPSNAWQRLRAGLIAGARARLSQSFAEGCERLFSDITLQPAAHVFIATASEIDLTGLARFLARARPPSSVTWHLQFHFGMFRGRDPAYASQQAAQTAMGAVFQAALADANGHRLRFYCTTDPLTAQYRRLGVGSFQTLPYPVHGLFSARRELRLAPAPARIACLGHSRREKGYGELPRLLRNLWSPYFVRGQAQLVLQTQRARQRQALQRVVDDLSRLQPRDNSVLAPAVAYAPAPLDLPKYADLVRDSDIGLLLYDSERYYDRCSGVLLELLTAAVPVVVPAGSWLAEQIAPVNQSWLRQVESRAQDSGTGSPLTLHWLQAPAGLQSSPATADGPLPPQCGALLLSFDWRAPTHPGTYLRIEMEQRDALGATVATDTQIAGRNVDDSRVRVLFALQPRAVRLTLRLSNAWSGDPLTIDNMMALALPGDAPPLGAIGLTIAHNDDAAGAASDILRHIAHYRQQSATFAADCARRHSAASVIERLVAAA